MSRGKAKKTLALIDEITRILEEIQPASVRAVCYRLFTAGYIDSMGKNNTGMVSKQLVWAREQGLIPWNYIVDETRSPERVNTWNNPDEIIRAAVRGYRKDYWRDQPSWVEVWSEKGTVRGTLEPVLSKYGVTFRVMHGFGSATALHDIAMETMESDKELIVLYVGDWDCSGMSMSEVDLPSRINRYEGTAVFTRVALDESDVQTGKLPSFSAADKKCDPRYKWFVDNYGDRCWELDALSPVVLRQRIENFILSYIDVDQWNHCVKVEAAEVASMQEFHEAWSSKLRLGSNSSEVVP